MNKLISKIAVLGASIGMAVAVGVAVSHKSSEVARADEDTYSFIESIPTGWVADQEPTGYEKTGSLRGAQWSKKSFTLTFTNTSAVSSVVVTASTNGTANLNSLEVAVGGNSYGTKTMPKENHHDFEFEGSSSGNVVVSFTSGGDAGKSIYVESIKVTTGAPKVLESVSITKDDSQVKKTYFEGEAASTAGLTVFAHYDSGDPVDVTAKAEITANPASVALSTTSISYTASFGNKTSEPVVVDGITVTEHDYSGTFVLASNTTTYTQITTDEVFHQKITNADSFTASDFDQGFRVGGSPNASDIMLGSNKDHGGTVKLTVPAGYVISTVVLNGKSDSSGDSELTIGGYTKTVTNSDYADYSFYNLGNSVTLTSSIRIWAKTITIAVAKVTTGSVANAYAAAFIAMTSADCTAKNVSEATWAAVKAVFQNIERDFASEAALIKAADESVEAIARYKFIVEKYGYEDFLNKGYEVGKYLELGVAAPQGVAGYVIVISIGTASILAIGLVLMLKKKKHTK